MTEVSGFAPVDNPSARALILGSMPGVASLAAGQYYAHPRNAFWRLMGDITGAGPELPYDQRLARLRAHGLALWDVLRSCQRPGSLDADIRPASMVANDFAGFLARHPDIRLIAFNGATAESSFMRHALPALTPALQARLRLLRLPSTSPAHAGMTYAAKLTVWREALGAV